MSAQLLHTGLSTKNALERLIEQRFVPHRSPDDVAHRALAQDRVAHHARIRWPRRSDRDGQSAAKQPTARANASATAVICLVIADATPLRRCRSVAAAGARRDRRDPHDRRARPDPYPGPRGPTDRRDPNPAGTGRPGTPPTAAHRQGRPARRGQTSRGGDGGIADHVRRARRRRRRRPPTRKRFRPRSPPTPPPDTAGRSSLPAAAQQPVRPRAGREVAGSGVRLLGSSSRSCPDAVRPSTSRAREAA